MASTNQRSWTWALILTLVIGLVFLKAFLGVIALALLLAYIFYPLQKRFEKRIKNKSLAVTITTFVSFFTLAIPIIIVLILAVSQATSLVNDLNLNSVTVGGSNLDEKALTISHKANDVIDETIGIKNAISDSQVENFTHTTLPQALKAILGGVVNIVSGIPGFFTMLILYLFVFCASLMAGDKLVDTAKKLSPFDKKVNEMYTKRIGAMAKAMIKGQLLIALCQGVESAAILALVGFGSYFWFMAIIFTFLSFIPLGAGIITIPIGIAMILFGNISGGLIVLLNHFLVVTNIDNYIRPKVVPKEARLPASLTILGAFAGVSYFGFLGVIYGPIIMIIITTTIEAYIRQKSISFKTTS